MSTPLASAEALRISDFNARLARAMRKDWRFAEDAYLFTMAALHRALRYAPPRHVSASELLAAIREEAHDQFGPMGEEVFRRWGLKNSLDFGRVVFNMVREGILSKSETDRFEDFHDPDFFQNLFDAENAYRLRSAVTGGRGPSGA